MNKRGSVVIYALMLGMVVILLALALAPVGNEFIQKAMNNTEYINQSYEVLNSSGDIELINGHIETQGLDCNNSSISNFNKATCTITDFSMAYFFGGLILIGGALIIAKIIF